MYNRPTQVARFLVLKYNLNHINEIARFLGCSPRKFLPEEPL